MHSDRLGGPVWIFLMLVMVLAVGLAVFVVVDSARRFRRCAPDGRPWLLFYACLEGLYLLMLGVAQLSVVPRIFAAVAAVATPLALILGFAYLLRVAYPKHPERTPACELDTQGRPTSPAPPVGPPDSVGSPHESAK